MTPPCQPDLSGSHVVRTLIGVAVAALVCVGCGGPEPVHFPVFDAGPYVVPDQIAYDTHITDTVGADCSTQPCPHYLNMQCIPIAGRHECHFVMRPQDTCETGFAQLSTATWNRLITRDGITVCTKECIKFDDTHGVQFACPQQLECVDKIPAAAPNGEVGLHGGCFH